MRCSNFQQLFHTPSHPCAALISLKSELRVQGEERDSMKTNENAWVRSARFACESTSFSYLTAPKKRFRKIICGCIKELAYRWEHTRAKSKNNLIPRMGRNYAFTCGTLAKTCSIGRWNAARESLMINIKQRSTVRFLDESIIRRASSQTITRTFEPVPQFCCPNISTPLDWNVKRRAAKSVRICRIYSLSAHEKSITKCNLGRDYALERKFVYEYFKAFC